MAYARPVVGERPVYLALEAAGGLRWGVSEIRAVQVQALTKRFGAVTALRKVSVRFRGGAITALCGPNGAGKSTLLAAVGTVLTPTSGSIEYPPLGTDRRGVRARLGWVAHDSHCYGQLTARENVEFAASLYGCRSASTWDRVASRVGAEELAGRRVDTLSQGQRQRIALARALVHQPSLLLLDEPASGLDVDSVERLEQVLREERERGAVVIVVSHSTGFIERIADEERRLDRGRLAQ